MPLLAQLDPGAGRLWFGMQAVAGAAWWPGVFLVEDVRLLTLGDLDPLTVAALDIPLFVIASGLVAVGVRMAVWIVVPWTILVAAGMVGYATLTGLAGWGALAMILAAGGSILAGLLVTRGRLPTEWLLVGPFAFRPAAESSNARVLARTFSQLAVFWGVFLLALPLLIGTLERLWGLAVPVALLTRAAGVGLIVVASALGIWSAVTMATTGGGTPLPATMPRRLVIDGPYRFVRNPMAIAGIAQGVGVGALMGSWLVILYSLAGSLLWNAAIRPLEEADLEQRFGVDYVSYRGRVRCWVPRLRPVARIRN